MRIEGNTTNVRQEEKMECNKCKGRGKISRDIEGDDDCCTPYWETVQCDKCNGTGKQT